jgi:hypothetical protein
MLPERGAAPVDEPELVHVAAEPGMKQGVETRLAPPGTLAYAQNVRFEKGGRIAKRGGSSLIGSDLPAATVGGSWIHENYACIDDEVHQYNAAGDTWLGLGAELGLDHPFVPIGRFAAALDEGNLAGTGLSGSPYNTIATLGGVLIVATSGASSSGETTVVALDDSGRVLWKLAPFSGHRPRFVLAGGTLYLLTMTSAFGLESRTLTAAGTLGSPVALLSSASLAYFDAAPLAGSNDWVLAYHDGGNIGVLRYTGTSANASSGITTTETPEEIAVAGGGATNDTIWVAWHDNSNGLLVNPQKWDLSAAWGATLLVVATSATAIPTGQPAILRLSATEAVVACTFNLFSAAPIVTNAVLHTRRVDNSGGAGATVKHHGWKLASKPWPVPASSVSPRRIRYLVATADFNRGAHGILELGEDAEGGAIVGLSSEREARVTDQLTDCVVYDPGSGDSRIATVATWSARLGIGSILNAADLLVIGGRHMGNGTRFASSAARQVHQGPFGALAYLSGGASLVELQPAPVGSSRRFAHNGFALFPSIRGEAQTGGSLTASTPYNYVATYEQFDAAGQRCRSEPSAAITVTTNTTDKTARIHATVPGGTGRPNVRLHVWRSWDGGPYYRVTPDGGAPQCTDEAAQPVSDFVQYDDALSDANAAVREQLDTLSLPNAPPSGGRIAAIGAGRMFVTDWIGRVQVSKLIIPGEPIQFVDDDSFRILPPETPTGLAVLDGALVIFTAAGIYVVPIGIGPTDQGQNPYDVPSALPVDDGCVNPRSVVVTSAGILYQARRGLMILPRGFGQPQNIDDVSEELEARPYVLSAAKSSRLDGTELVHFVISTSDAAPASDSRVLTVDVTLGAWSVDLFSPGIAALGTRQGRLALIAGGAVADAARWVPEDGSVWSDRDNAGAEAWVEMRLRFAQLRPFGIAGYGEFVRMVGMFEALGVGSTILEFGLSLESTLDEGLDVEDQPEVVKWQIPDDLQTTGVAVGKAMYFGREFTNRQGSALALELYDGPPDENEAGEVGAFAPGFVLHGFSLEVQRQRGLRRIPEEMQR